jgi:WD40 repeat protein
MGVANDLLITGDNGGHLRLIDPRNGNELQKFHNHKAKITDIYADRFRVLSCSSDFSIRVYRWLGVTQPGQPVQLEDRYTLLGGSVALKKHDGFNRLLCEASSCVGVAGNQLKFYTFSTNLEPAAS